MSKQNNLYKILEVNQNVTSKDLKTAFFKLSKKYHPDVIGTYDTQKVEKFLKIKEAYDILRNEEKRKLYDKKINLRTFTYTGGFSQAQNQWGDNFSGTCNEVCKFTKVKVRAGQFYNPTKEVERELQEKKKFCTLIGLFIVFVIATNVGFIKFAKKRATQNL